ncbi:hypothetical protein [Erythrobacter sp. WG]|uniref:hypothetical protein n=1 Tax=Erythrobacter sp. WG TaxID=2985510 RepID=UPI00226DA6C2|nr:hypothetical protein [Erythrobacter sp. WG]MCX9148598.1 hypothetical protein [Erythrobacter sp. WG]
MLNVLQEGSDNTSDIVQGGAGNGVGTTGSAGVIQLSDDNTATIRQAGGLQDAFVEQKGGDFNTAAINQGANSATDHTAAIRQDGGANTADILQRGFNQRATITQIGDDNSGSGTFAFGAQIIQGDSLGRDNEATITQLSDGNRALVNQQGRTLAANVTQGGNGGNTSTVIQNGNGGAVLLNADVLQNGADNTSLVNQGGSDQTASVDQLGEENLSQILQTGSGHTASVTQNSDLNQSQINQAGTGHTASVTQGF